MTATRAPKIAILGGGISGLACAYRLLGLAQKDPPGVDLTLFEAGERLGGTIETEQRDEKKAVKDSYKDYNRRVDGSIDDSERFEEAATRMTSH